MTTVRFNPVSSLYETDYLRWLETTAEALKRKDFGAIDWENVIEEIEDMGRRERKSLKSNLVVLLLHLLKWQFQAHNRSNSWKASIVEHRQRLRDSLRESPSLRPYLDSILAESYADAVERAVAETGVSATAFPSGCPYGVEAVLDKDFWPEI